MRSDGRDWGHILGKMMNINIPPSWIQQASLLLAPSAESVLRVNSDVTEWVFVDSAGTSIHFCAL